MGKKGFTLVELLAVISIMAIIAVLATPNIVNMVDNSKKEQFVTDAKEMIAKAQYRYRLPNKYGELFVTSGTCQTITLKNLGYTKFDDADGGTYDLDNTKVQVCKNIKEIWSVITKTTKDGEVGRGISDGGNFVSEDKLSKKYVS